MLDLRNAPTSVLADWFDETPPVVIADWLDSHVTGVDRHMLPNWLRWAWTRNTRHQSAFVVGGLSRHLDSGSIAGEIDRWLSRQVKSKYHGLDHWGKTVIEGHICFVNEPYRTTEEVFAGMQLLATVVGGRAAYSRSSDCGRGAVRGILFPFGVKDKAWWTEQRWEHGVRCKRLHV